MFRRLVSPLVAAALIVPGNLAAAQQGCPTVTVRGVWRAAALPATGVTDYAVEPLVPSRIYVTNGTSLMLSTDAGCTWEEVFTVGGAPRPDLPLTPLARITGIEVVRDRLPASVYLLVEEEVGPAQRVHVVASSDGGATWELRDDGLPPLSGPAVELDSAPGDPSALYLLLRHTPQSGGEEVFASDNGGRTWVSRSRDATASNLGFDVDPVVEDALLLWGAPGLSYSADGGRSISTFSQVASGVLMADIFHAPGGPARIMAYELETQTFNVSDDGGATWYRIGGPRGFALSMAHGATEDDVVVSVHEAFYKFSAPRFWTEVALPVDEDVGALSSDATATPAIYGITDTKLMTYTGLNGEVDIGILGVGPELEPKLPPRLAPPRRKITIPAGKKRNVPYDFTLPAASLPLDVFFLVDTTQSMTSTISGLRHGMSRIVDDLASREIDVGFGVGEYKDYPTPGYGDPLAGDFPYRRLRAIGPADDSLATALEQLEASGGGDIPESQLTGLYQTVTGEGEAGFVAAGQDADFRPNSLRVIVNITDAPFNDSLAHPAPQFQAVADELLSAGVLQIGLAIFGPNGVQGAKNSLAGMASATGAVAPPGGVDCDGDAVIDIAAGSPLVCEIRDEISAGVLDLAPAILAALEAVTRTASVEFATAGDDAVVEAISPDAPTAVNLLETSNLGLAVTYACPESESRSRHQVQLSVSVRDDEVATARTTVICLPLPPVEIPPPLAAAIAPLVPVAPRVLVPPPQVPHEIPLQQPNVQGQGALAQQRQHQQQVALVHSGGRAEQIAEAAAREDRSDYAFSSLRREEPAPALVYGTAAVIALAYAAASLMARRTAVARQTTRSGRSPR